MTKRQVGFVLVGVGFLLAIFGFFIYHEAATAAHDIRAGRNYYTVTESLRKTPIVGALFPKVETYTIPERERAIREMVDYLTFLRDTSGLSDEQRKQLLREKEEAQRLQSQDYWTDKLRDTSRLWLIVSIIGSASVILGILMVATGRREPKNKQNAQNEGSLKIEAETRKQSQPTSSSADELQAVPAVGDILFFKSQPSSSSANDLQSEKEREEAQTKPKATEDQDALKRGKGIAADIAPQGPAAKGGWTLWTLVSDDKQFAETYLLEEASRRSRGGTDFRESMARIGDILRQVDSQREMMSLHLRDTHVQLLDRVLKDAPIVNVLRQRWPRGGQVTLTKQQWVNLFGRIENLYSDLSARICEYHDAIATAMDTNSTKVVESFNVKDSQSDKDLKGVLFDIETLMMMIAVSGSHYLENDKGTV